MPPTLPPSGIACRRASGASFPSWAVPSWAVPCCSCRTWCSIRCKAWRQKTRTCATLWTPSPSTAASIATPRPRPPRRRCASATDAPQLAADLEAAAKEAGIQIPETADRPDAPAGKRYVEHSLDVKLRKVDLVSLATFLSKVETGKNLVLITRLQIRRSFGGDGNSVDVDLTATAWETSRKAPRSPRAPVPWQERPKASPCLARKYVASARPA
jgi:hypothetical protein